MSSEEKLNLIKQVKENIETYLSDQLAINIEALKAYDNDSIKDDDIEIRKMREIEAIKLRDRINELNRHLAVIKRMM